MLRPILGGIAAAALGCLMFGCDSKDPNSASTGTSQTPYANTDTKKDTKTDVTPPPPKGPPKGDVAVIETNLGTIKFTLLDNETPKTVANFEKLADQKFYDGTKFHRVIPGFMIQGGDPNSKGKNRATMGMGGPGYTIEDEFTDTTFDRGIVGMANTGGANTGGCQFYIMVAPHPDLDNKYAAFGKVTQGMDVADKIVALKRDSKDNPLDANPAIVKSIRIIHAAGATSATTTPSVAPKK